MPKITEERMREIMIGMYPSKQVIDSIINHPEIKSLFEEANVIIDEIDEFDCKMPYCPKCKASPSENQPYCGGCGQKLIWHTDEPWSFALWVDLQPNEEPKEIVDNSEVDNGNSQGMLDGSIKAYDVVQYEIAKSNEFSTYTTQCKKRDDRIWFIGGVNCGNCKHFQGHEIEGKSIRCAFEVNNKLKGGEV